MLAQLPAAAVTPDDVTVAEANPFADLLRDRERATRSVMSIAARRGGDAKTARLAEPPRHKRAFDDRYVPAMRDHEIL